MDELKWHLRRQPRNVEGIVEQQVRRWQFNPSRPKDAFWPVVTISRESGSLGLALGRRVAERLGFSFWDQELVQAVADKLHVNPSALLLLDEHAPGKLEAISTAFRMRQVALSHDYCDQLKILLASIGHHGSAVVVGRGAHCAIPTTQALKVRLVASLEKRIEDYSAYCQTTREAAARQVVAGDRERAEFVRRVFHSEVSDPTSYDLVINVATYSPRRADSMILMAYLAKFGQIPDEARESAIPPAPPSIRPTPALHVPT
jgi:cytidylate kinase